MSDYNEHLISMAGGDGDVPERIREAKAAALEEAAIAWREYLPKVAGYGVVQPVPVWLERRAEWLRESKP